MAKAIFLPLYGQGISVFFSNFVLYQRCQVILADFCITIRAYGRLGVLATGEDSLLGNN